MLPSRLSKLTLPACLPAGSSDSATPPDLKLWDLAVEVEVEGQEEVAGVVEDQEEVAGVVEDQEEVAGEALGLEDLVAGEALDLEDLVAGAPGLGGHGVAVVSGVDLAFLGGLVMDYATCYLLASTACAAVVCSKNALAALVADLVLPDPVPSDPICF
ncbi:uncharacterized protein LOC110761779 [Prunus avium]|uniref:Uncharacterized protein LOC110761779 n=1 Tax=Prunus avium TaxID=42229 RepID=A0A6P5T0I5_PRUAV|nr:uncharacterized protein LOC110761779 [Prunus avium]